MTQQPDLGELPRVKPEPSARAVVSAEPCRRPAMCANPLSGKSADDADAKLPPSSAPEKARGPGWETWL
jgi:hypothetical protein